MRNAIPQGMTAAEAQELQAEMSPDEWVALHTVQAILTSAPALGPDEGFSARVLARLAAQERKRAQRRSIVGALALVLGSLAVSGFFILGSAGEAWFEVGGASGLINGLIAFLTYAQTFAILFSSFAAAVLNAVGGGPAVGLALFAFTLTLVWVWLMGSAPSSRPITREA